MGIYVEVLVHKSFRVLYLHSYFSFRASLVTQIGKNLPVMQETRVWSLIQEDPLEKEMAVFPYQ